MFTEADLGFNWLDIYCDTYLTHFSKLFDLIKYSLIPMGSFLLIYDWFFFWFMIECSNKVAFILRFT